MNGLMFLVFDHVADSGCEHHRQLPSVQEPTSPAEQVPFTNSRFVRGGNCCRCHACPQSWVHQHQLPLLYAGFPRDEDTTAGHRGTRHEAIGVVRPVLADTVRVWTAKKVMGKKINDTSLWFNSYFLARLANGDLWNAFCPGTG